MLNCVVPNKILKMDKTGPRKNSHSKNKNTRRPGILAVIFYAAIAAGFVLLHVVLKLEIKNLTKEKIDLDKEISAMRDKNIALTVEVQKLQSEERIQQIAESRLQMMKNMETISLIYADKAQVEQITGIINDKYQN